MLTWGSSWTINIIPPTGVANTDAYFTLIWVGMVLSVGVALVLRVFTKS